MSDAIGDNPPGISRIDNRSTPARIDFTAPYTGPVNEYTFNQQTPQHVRRDTFVSFLTQSFAISRGELAAQLCYIDWLSARTEQDLMQVVKDFIHVETRKPLSPTEKTYLHDKFQSVGGHEKIADVDEFVYSLFSNLHEFGINDGIKRKMDAHVGNTDLSTLSREQAMGLINNIIQDPKTVTEYR